MWQLLWSYSTRIAGEVYGKAERIKNTNNVLDFVPLGFLFPKKRRNVVLIAALIFSAFIEIIQFAFALGWCEIDDIIYNMLGPMIGLWIWTRFKGEINATGEKTWFI